MFVKNDIGEYELRIERLTFVCDEVHRDYELKAKMLAKAYRNRLDRIGKFLIDEGIEEVFGEQHPAKLMRALGKPIINLDNSTLTYADHSLDDYSIITLEFDGLFDELSYLCIDG